ncbi:MAG: bifunctional phosphoribosylaminoimidazolecarboxamide formyltransferase/IMP cyclohydrolase, partial [Propionibacteriaceae bacterium]|nr:bifunctional phosphoribosylaminoimidazolecarboxamide formyltransferase/IMP cyclohydrolase [Propionibacteriaceae bacterium]
YDFQTPCVAIFKHANPCGIAIGADVADAYAKAHACDPLSAYGGVAAANREFNAEAASQLAEVFTEVVVAPGYSPEALEILTRKKNLRILQVSQQLTGWMGTGSQRELRPISGGVLVQDADRLNAPGDDPSNWQLVSGEPVDEQTLADLVFAWRACRCVKSNAILLAEAGASVGVGMGQVNRVDACQLAIERAQDRADGAVAASDAFFPFADGPQLLIAAGVRAIVQPGGSVRDQDTIEAANAAGVSMYLTGTRHFFH